MFLSRLLDRNNLKATFAIVLSALYFSNTSAQTTFTESAASYGLNLGQRKDGGHAWSDYDNDGDLDVLVLENQNGSTRSFLMRNNGNNTFTDVRAALVSGMGNDVAERQAAWGDLNNDGRPDFMITSHGNGGGGNRAALQIYIQNASGTFGDGIGGNNPITVGRSGYTIDINPINAEGAGFFDFEGDGDLDIFFDSHNYGIELLRNNYIDHTTSTVTNPAPNVMFTHITNLNGSPNVQFGLNQFATDGDYGSAADVNDDGWVDIFMRKRDENDFFLNQGGTFTNGADLAQAENGNKGANGLWDLDNDGDLDAVWTENGLTQIFQNDGPGIWTPLGTGTFPGLPQPGNVNNGSSSDDIDALAGGDIDNDGDIDILFVGDNRSYLFINQLNSPTPAPGIIGSGAAMSFSLDSETFNSGRNGEGTTMVDIDDDGDLDIYMNIDNNANQLYINNLPAANRNNHLVIDVTEDRGADGSTGGFPGRVALGTNVLIRDCTGNIISGLRQVNGVYGHGTQQPEQVHFGLPLGENETYIIEVRYPNFVHPTNGVTRLIATVIAQPSTIPGTNHYDMTTTDAESIENVNAPIANDDLETVPYGVSVSVQISLFDNDSEPDGENFFISSVVQPPIGSVVIDDADAGLVTFTYSSGTPFPGTTFDYTITDSTESLCPALGKSDTATVTVYEPCADPAGLDSDGDGINDVCDEDDDNDGILDSAEAGFNVLWVTDGAPSPEEQLAIDKLTALGYSVTVVDDNVGGDANLYDVTFIYEDANSGTALANVSNMVNTEKGVITSETFLHDDLIGANTGDTNNTNIINITNNTHPITSGITLGNYDIGDASFRANGIVTGTVLGLHPSGEVSLAVWEQGDVLDNVSPAPVNAPGRRTIVPHSNSNGGFNVNGEDLLVNAIIWTASRDTDLDGVDDILDLDSDNDGIFDVVEAGHDVGHSGGRLTGNVDSDGVLDAIQASGQETNGTINYTVLNSDAEGDADYVDLDSDGDGCNDVIEAGYTENSSQPGELQGTGYDINTGLVTGNVDGYTTPDDNDVNGTYDYREAGSAPSISVQPQDQNISVGDDAVFSVNASGNGLTYQWEVSTDGGSSYAMLSAETTSNLTIPSVTATYNGYLYRVIISSTSYNCANTISASAVINITLPDFDSDGVPDITDRDDDNDGILDAVENSCGPNVAGFDAYWPLDNNTNDASGNGHNLQNGLVTYSALSTRGVAATSFNGTSDNLRYSDGTFLNQAITNFSYSIWVNPNTLSGTQIILDEGGTGNGIAVRLNGNILESAVREGGAGSQVGTSTFNFPNDGAWHHIVLTYANGDVVLYLDGIASNTLNTGFGQLSAHGSAQNFGRTDGGDAFGSSGSNFFSGLMDEIVHYPFPLTDTQVNSLMAYSCDADSDGIINSFDANSDNEGCNDAEEAYNDSNADADNNGMYGSGSPGVNPDGTVTAASYALPADRNFNGTYDFIEVNSGPIISLQPQDQNITAGNNANFSVTAVGFGLTYQWQVSIDNGTTYNDITGETSANLTITNVSTSDSGNLYRVFVFEGGFGCSATISNAALLTVIPADFDNDGIADESDLDDDNDGILDTVEATNCSPSDPKIDVVIFSESFGSATGSRTSTPYTNYVYEDGTGSGGGSANLNDGEYTIFENISSTASWAPSIWQTQGDHTTGSDRMMIVNANNTAGLEFYRRTLVQVVENVPLDISFWVMNLDTDIPGNSGRTEPNITALIQQGGSTVFSFDTNAVAREADGAANAWKQYTGTFTPTSSTALEIVLINNAPGGLGNDLALDDIEVIQSFCDTDGNGVPNSQQADSDGDGCNDADEAYGDANADADNNGMYGSGVPAVNPDGTVSSASYQTPVDGDANGIYDFLEFGTAPTITVQPIDTATCPGCSASFTVASSNADTFQWQLFNGTTWDDITDSATYSGSDTNNLVITNASPSDNGNDYRVIVANSAFSCSMLTSNTATLTVRVTTVITNRRITYRVRKN